MSSQRKINTNHYQESREINLKDRGKYVEGDYYSSSKTGKSLTEAITEVQNILAKLNETYPNNMPMQAVETIKEIDNRPPLKQKLISAAKQAGIKGLEKALDNPAGAMIVGAIEGWIISVISYQLSVISHQSSV